MSTLTVEEQEALKKEIATLEASLVGDLFADMEAKDKIHNLKMKLEGIRPGSSEIECVGCGS